MKKLLRSGSVLSMARIFGRVVEVLHLARIGEVSLLLLCFFLMIGPTKGIAARPWEASKVGTKTMSTPASQTFENSTDIDRLIDAYRQASAEKKAMLMQRIRSRIVDEVTGEQQTTIAEIIRLKKLQAEEKRYSQERRKSSESAKKSRGRKVGSSHRCRSLECTLRRVKSSLRHFFRKATAKRRHPAKKPKAEDVLKGKVE